MTKGYMYSMYGGADPKKGWIMNDPIFGRPPTLGACMPNVRRNVNIGDYIFVISGKIVTAPQYVVGGFRVAEKIDQLAAYERYPEYRMQRAPNDEQNIGNIIIDEDGKQHPLDDHTSFEKRLDNYLIGEKPIMFNSEKAVEEARQQTLPFLQDLFGKKANRVYDVMGRGARKMNAEQIERVVRWIEDINQRTK